jgi:tetratricopeptide (TPR) repeat protein
MSDQVNSLASIISALGALLAGIGAILPLKNRQISSNKKNRNNRILGKNYRGVMVVIGLVVLSFGAGMFAGPVYNQWRTPLNMQITNRAWDALNRGDFDSAITIAQKCINRFRHKAHDKQTELIIAKTPAPPIGQAMDSKNIQDVLSWGLLNDVAACYYIQGLSAERMNKLNEAKQHYQKSITFSYARVWDRRGFFWSPSEAATIRLNNIGQH